MSSVVAAIREPTGFASFCIGPGGPYTQPPCRCIHALVTPLTDRPSGHLPSALAHPLQPLVHPCAEIPQNLARLLELPVQAARRFSLRAHHAGTVILPILSSLVAIHVDFLNPHSDSMVSSQWWIWLLNCLDFAPSGHRDSVGAVRRIEDGS